MAQPITTVTAREFVHNVSASKRVASEGGTVIITDPPTLRTRESSWAK